MTLSLRVSCSVVLLLIVLVNTQLLSSVSAANNNNNNHPLLRVERGWRRSWRSLPNKKYPHRRPPNSPRMTDNNNTSQSEDDDEEEQAEMTSLFSANKKSLLTRGGTASTCTSEDSFYSAASSEEEEDDDEEGLELTSLLLNTRGGGSSRDATAAAVTRGGAKQDPDDPSLASMTSSVFNLVNNVAGAGILALSAGMSGGTGWIPAVLICMALGVLSSHTFQIIGTACELTGERDFKGLWARTIGPDTTYIVDSIIAVMCVACAIIYSGILGDVFTPLLDQAGLPAQYNARSSNIILITTLLLLPLSLIKNLSALAFTSLLGFGAIAYTVFFIVVRALDGSYTLGSGHYVQLVTSQGTPGAGASLTALPSFERPSLWGFGFTSLVLMSNLGLAFIAHYNSRTYIHFVLLCYCIMHRFVGDVACRHCLTQSLLSAPYSIQTPYSTAQQPFTVNCATPTASDSEKWSTFPLPFWCSSILLP